MTFTSTSFAAAAVLLVNVSLPLQVILLPLKMVMLLSILVMFLYLMQWPFLALVLMSMPSSWRLMSPLVLVVFPFMFCSSLRTLTQLNMVFEENSLFSNVILTVTSSMVIKLSG
ncbi:hypothetical protein BC941DRAFT_216108 [Chlamydoabsidia padenii]|nr:hypothetical protein BC941DRAFT_216108 [Chlamydoabsidia padenii]